MLYDPGVYPEPPLSGKITWRVTNPQKEPKSEEEQVQYDKLRALMERAKAAAEKRKNKE